MQLIWLGSQQLDKVTTTDIQLLNASIHPCLQYEISASQSTVGLYDGRPRHRRLPYRLFLAARQLRSVVQPLTSEAADSLVHAFISCRLDYCTALCCTALQMANCSDCNQSTVQNAAAHLVTGTRRMHRPHYAGSPVTSLAVGATTRHFQVGDTDSQVLERPNTWLSGRRLPFRFAGRGRFGSRSAASMMPDIPDRTTTSLGDRAFAVAGPCVWILEQPSSCHP